MNRTPACPISTPSTRPASCRRPVSCRRGLRIALAVTALAVAGLTGCGSSSGTTAAAGSGTASATPTTAASQAPALTVSDAWVRAQDGEMSAMFGVVKNSSGAAVMITSGMSDIGMIELHEVVMDAEGKATMRVREGGFEVPAGGELVLQPGADHVMLMGLKKPIKVGEQVKVMLSASDGSTLEVAATARNFTAEEEAYEQKVFGDDGHTHTHGSTASPSMTMTP